MGIETKLLCCRVPELMATLPILRYYHISIYVVVKTKHETLN